MDSSRERGQDTAQPWKAVLFTVPGTLGMQPNAQTPAAFLPVTWWARDRRQWGLTQGRLSHTLEQREAGRFSQNPRWFQATNTDFQIALHLYKIWEHFPAACLRGKHKYPPFFHTLCNCCGRRPHCGAGSLPQPTPATFASRPAQGPQSQVHGTEHCLGTRRYQDHF